MKSIALACFSILVVSNSWQGVTARKPTMTPSGEILIQEGDELRIDCHSEFKLQVSPRKLELYGFRQSKLDISRDEKSGKITFIRPRTEKEDTGWYACAEEGVKITNDEQNVDHESEDIVWLYVFVNSVHPFAAVYHSGDMEVIQGGRVVIPCRPTSPTLPVKLDIKKYSKPMGIPANTTYDPKIGFTVNNIGREFNFAQFCCRTDDGQYDVEWRYVHMQSNESYWNGRTAHRYQSHRKVGTAEFDVRERRFAQSHALFNSFISIFVIVTIILIIVIGYMGFKLNREKILRKELLDAAYFRNGEVVKVFES